MKTRVAQMAVGQRNAPKKKRGTIKMPWKDRVKVRRYFGEQPWMIRKLAHILKSSGPGEAARWAAAKDVAGILREIERQGIGSNGGRNTKIAKLAGKALKIGAPKPITILTK